MTDVNKRQAQVEQLNDLKLPMEHTIKYTRFREENTLVLRPLRTGNSMSLVTRQLLGVRA